MTQDAIILVLSCLGLVQAIFLCSYFLTLKKGNRKANIFLALFLLGLTIRIGKSVLNVYLDLGPWQRNLGISGILLAGPFLWFYGRLILKREKNFLAKNYLHLIPFAGFVLFCTIIPNDSRPISHYFYLSVFVHLLFYLGLSARLFFRHKANSNTSLTKLYRNLLIGTGLIWLFYMGNLAGIFPFYIGGAIFFSLLVYILSFLLLKRPLFTMEKYANSTMDRASSEKHLKQLKILFENEQKNFSEFVNGYRIEKAKKLLVNPEYEQEKIASIAYDCGFGNVTSFNLAFKAATQLTPSQYRKRLGAA